MHSLFILGNGFDLHHGLPTRYTDFMAFMKQRHSKVARDFIKGVGLYSLHYWNVNGQDICQTGKAGI